MNGCTRTSVTASQTPSLSVYLEQPKYTKSHSQSPNTTTSACLTLISRGIQAHRQFELGQTPGLSKGARKQRTGRKKQSNTTYLSHDNLLIPSWVATGCAPAAFLRSEMDMCCCVWARAECGCTANTSPAPPAAIEKQVMD